MNLPQLVAQHKDTLDRLYNATHRTYGKEFETAFKALDAYLETHNLSLATVSKIMDYGKPEVESDNFLDLA